MTYSVLLAGGIVALKTAGLAVGWGLQFQHPAFLVLMTALLTLFAGNLAGPTYAASARIAYYSNNPANPRETVGSTRPATRPCSAG